MRVDVRSDISGALKKFGLAKTEAKGAIRRALNKTATTARAQSAREIKSAGYGLKIGEIKKAVSITKAGTELRAILKAIGRPIPLIRYSARQTGTGVTVNVKNGRRTILHAFIATMPSGHRGVFVRVKNHAAAKALQTSIGKWGGHLSFKGTSKKKEPINQLFGPSIPTAFANKVVMGAMTTAVKQRFPVVLEQELKFLASKINH